MKLKAFKYWERSESGEEWEIERLTFSAFNLIVGRNATGKTRLLKAIARVAGEFSGEAKNVSRAMKFEFVTDDPSAEAKAEWGRRAQYFPFAARMNVKTPALRRLELTEAYRQGSERPEFRERILAWMNEVGYALESIQVAEPKAGAFALEVKEEKRATNTPLRRLSQGQQRALALLTFLALLEADPEPATVLIDDFAEGLDFEHARLLTEFLLRYFPASPLQFIIATNDRYVMNAAPLEHWTVLVEEGKTTRVFNYANSKEKFDDFKFTGLNNFDFFSMDFAQPEA